MSVKIHEELTVDDLFRASEVIGAILEELDAATLERIQSRQIEKSEAGRMVVTIGLRVAPVSGKRFLAGLVDKSPEEFGALPMSTTLDVVEQLTERDDLGDFFKRARDLVASIGTSTSKEEQETSASGS